MFLSREIPEGYNMVMLSRVWLFLSLCWALLILFVVESTPDGWECMNHIGPWLWMFAPLLIGLFLRVLKLVAFLR